MPTGIGYFSFQMYANYDIRVNVDKLPIKYRENRGISSGATPPSPPSGIYTETPFGVIDDSNLVYTVGHSINVVYSFIINGEYIDSGMYSISGKTITFTNPLPASLSGTPFEIVYLGSNT